MSPANHLVHISALCSSFYPLGTLRKCYISVLFDLWAREGVGEWESVIGVGSLKRVGGCLVCTYTYICTLSYSIMFQFIIMHRITIQWNLSIKVTLNRGHSSNEDTVCSPNNIELCTNLPLN